MVSGGTFQPVIFHHRITEILTAEGSNQLMQIMGIGEKKKSVLSYVKVKTLKTILLYFIYYWI